MNKRRTSVKFSSEEPTEFQRSLQNVERANRVAKREQLRFASPNPFKPVLNAGFTSAGVPFPRYEEKYPTPPVTYYGDPLQTPDIVIEHVDNTTDNKTVLLNRANPFRVIPPVADPNAGAMILHPESGLQGEGETTGTLQSPRNVTFKLQVTQPKVKWYTEMVIRWKAYLVIIILILAAVGLIGIVYTDLQTRYHVLMAQYDQVLPYVMGPCKFPDTLSPKALQLCNEESAWIKSCCFAPAFAGTAYKFFGVVIDTTTDVGKWLGYTLAALMLAAIIICFTLKGGIERVYQGISTNSIVKSIARASSSSSPSDA
jgi:hypothetical protein